MKDSLNPHAASISSLTDSMLYQMKRHGVKISLVGSENALKWSQVFELGQAKGSNSIFNSRKIIQKESSRVNYAIEQISNIADEED